MPEAPSLEDQPINDDAPEAPELSDQPGGDEDSLPEFDYSGIPDDQRETVESRIKGFQASYTQAMQGVSKERQDIGEARQAQEVLNALSNPATAPAVLTQLYTPQELMELAGYELAEDGDQGDEYVDPDERVEQIEGRLQTWEEQQQQALAQEAIDDYFGEVVEAAEKAEGEGFQYSPEELQIIKAFAYGNPDAQGVPDVEGGLRLLSSVLDQRQRKFIEGRKQTPRRVSNGSPAAKAVDLAKETPEERRARMLNAAESAEASEV